MTLLIQAGKMSLDVPDGVSHEDLAIIHQLRKSLIDAFLGIINGIKSPQLDGDDKIQHS